MTSATIEHSGHTPAPTPPVTTAATIVGKVQRSHLALAALATVVVPGIDIYQARPAPAADGFEAAYILDSHSRTWIVRAPLNPTAGAALEAEAAFLRSIEHHVDSGALPFVTPRPAGFAPLIEGGRAMVYPHLPGNQLRLERLRPGPGAAASLGRALGALHSLPTSILEDSAFPTYTAEQYRERKLAELDEGAASGLVPVTLLRRWEKALENVALWKFMPVVTHTNLSEDCVIMAHGQVSAIVDWSSVQVGDPAEDLAWLVAAAPMDSVDSIFEAYQMRRSEALDKHLIDRALLGSELAVLKWLLHGVHDNNTEVIDDAVSMLADLVEATTQDTSTGSFTVTTMPAPVDRAPSERVIGDTGPLERPAPADSSVPDSPASAETPVVDESAASPAAERSGSLPVAPSDPMSNEEVWTAAQPAVSTGHSEELRRALESGELSLPDYERATPPMPYADAQTEILTALPDPEDEQGEGQGARED